MTVIVKANTSGSEARKIRLSVNIKTVSYIGVSKLSIKKFTDTIEVKPGT